jgi:hypothetical protein
LRNGIEKELKRRYPKSINGKVNGQKEKRKREELQRK